ncbi:hypothetical protein PVAP13_1KG104254 [Panicum virgatum]|uniref:Uncharacterized protein n=1 Tax=Panicum virgatum TaxID=38727 RepID=A0A8T0XD87_PANVG|nr:hypothetical protein PVAP13_1KG104254 [Panicum virgatum]
MGWGRQDSNPAIQAQTLGPGPEASQNCKSLRVMIWMMCSSAVQVAAGKLPIVWSWEMAGAAREAASLAGRFGICGGGRRSSHAMQMQNGTGGMIAKSALSRPCRPRALPLRVCVVCTHRPGRRTGTSQR